MPVTVTPLGVRCNLQCGYCYEDPQRNAGNLGPKYDIPKIKAGVSRHSTTSDPFLLFGGEPLLLEKSKLEEIWSWGYARSGKNIVQTNGSLIDSDHIALFKRFNVKVGISIDGPASLNDARWNKSLKKTRASTRRTEEAITWLCREGIIPSLIVTLHRYNASAPRLDVLLEWFVALQNQGIRNVGLHLLEVENAQMRERYGLSAEETIHAVLAIRAFRSRLSTLKLSLLEDIDDLLRGKDGKARCIWRACDPLTTPAVTGLDGQGERTRCSRVNKEGVDFLPSSSYGYERYVALYHTPQTYGGCQGCRFFLMCRGQCPGTAVDGDWRNRSEQCATWKRVFEHVEQEIVASGETPLSLSVDRKHIEEELLKGWTRGTNVLVERLTAVSTSANGRRSGPQ